jgi:ribosome maturation factor RimP
MSADTVERVKVLAGPVLDELNIELVDVVLLTEGGRRVLRVFIDKPGGTTLDDCGRVSRELGTLLDVEDIIPYRYCLEVSSPGIDRPLVREKDFLNAVGKKVNIRTKEPLDGRRNFKATLHGLSDGRVIITDSNGRKWEIVLDNIEKARCEVEI